MSFINRNANLILLALIVLAAIALTGATIFFQKNFTDVNDRYNSKLDELNEITVKLKQYKEVLDQTKEEISLLRMRDEDFTEKFTSVKDEKEGLSDKNTRLTQEKGALQADLTSTLTLYEANKKDLQAAKVTIDELANERASLRSTVKQLKQDNRQLELKLEENGIPY